MKRGKVKYDDLKVGMEVVVNSGDDAIIYTIKAIEGFNVKLEYQTRHVTGKPVWTVGGSDGGWIDYSVCQYPTSSQLNPYRHVGRRVPTA